MVQVLEISYIQRQLFTTLSISKIYNVTCCVYVHLAIQLIHLVYKES